VHLVRRDAHDGARAVVLFTITPSEMICGVSALELGTYTASGVTATESEVLKIPAEAFAEALAQEAAFARDVLHLYAERIRHMAEQYGTMAEAVSRRVIRTILRLRGQFGATIPVTHRELAQMSWTTTESAIRAVRRLKRQGFVEGARSRLIVRSPKALERELAGRAGDGRPNGSEA
jgi:CRP-like cAMP-binding protein